MASKELAAGYRAMAGEDENATEGYLLLFQEILTIDKRRLLRKLGTLPAGKEGALDNALKISLAIAQGR